MEENFYNDGFEEFLQKQVKDQRMFPSDGVWRNIYKSLHGNTNWPALTVAAFAFMAAIVAITLYFSPSKNIFEVTATTNNNISIKKYLKNTGSDINLLNSLSSGTPNSIKAIPFIHPADDTKNSFVTVNTEPEHTSAVENINASVKDLTGNEVISGLHQSLINDLEEKSPFAKSNEETASLKEIKNLPEANTQKETGTDLQNLTVETADKKEDKAKIVEIHPAKNDDKVSLLSLQNQKSQKSKFSYVVYITPSRTYRSLTETPLTHGSALSNGPIAQNYVTDVNKIAGHRPGTGIEAGVSFLYKINKKLKITSGLQLNVRQYSMDAFLSTTELSTIALRTRDGIDSVNSFAVYRASNGYMPTELVNRFYQVSVPVGLQWEVISNKTVQLTIAGSIQPTYLLNKTAYLISTDYKNYTSNSDFIRNWNVNSNLEIFMSIKSGNYKWQLGPQIRYQNLPTFITQYPIHENLVDYGIKLGVSKNIQ